MASTNEYTELIAGAHREKERFTEWLYQLTQPLVDIKNSIDKMPDDYDIDLAEGKQLDAIGVRVGISRALRQRITDVFFAFDDVDGIGFDNGIWMTPRDSAYGINELSDEVYRAVLKTKIALNHHNGLDEGFEPLIESVRRHLWITSAQLTYEEQQNMSVSIQLHKRTVPPIVWKLFEDGIISLTHAGIEQKLSSSMEGILSVETGDLLADSDGNYLVMDIK